MDARITRAALLAACAVSLGAGHRTTNFVVTAPTPDFARAVAETAERNRRDLALDWLGHELPQWPQPCPVSVRVGPGMGAGGATSFAFHQGQPFGWTMSVQGPPDRILDSVIPHEVTHTIFATHFGQPLPRWADEGACTTVEHVSERQKQHRFLVQFLTTGRGIAFHRMFAMSEYPHDILPLYAQGYSLARFLISQGGRRRFVEYVGDGMQAGDWPAATQRHYGFQDLSDLQVCWLEWVKSGSRESEARELLASRLSARGGRAESGPRGGAPPVVRAQNDAPGRFVWPLMGRQRAEPATQLQPISWPASSPQPGIASPDPRRADPGDSQGSWYASQKNRSQNRPLREGAR